MKINKVDQFPDEIDDFWKMVRTENEIVLERTYTFLNWRFSKNFGDYQIYIGRSAQNDSILGYMVLRKTEIEAGHRGKIRNALDIVDLFALPSEEKLVLNFVNMAINTAKNEGLDVVHCRVPPWHAYVSILFKMGFIPLDRLFGLLKVYQPRIILYQFGTEEIFPNIHNWFYTLADTDYA